MHQPYSHIDQTQEATHLGVANLTQKDKDNEHLGGRSS